MYSLLIVEDERWEREGLARLWDWHELGIEIAGTAVDGIDGFEQAMRLAPDIIVTDIRMPGLNGLEMSRKIRERLSDVRIVMLTGYSDFEYTREAITLNADDYVLKPLEEEELRGTMLRVVEKCDKLGAQRVREARMMERLLAGERIAAANRIADLLLGRPGAGDPAALAAEALELDGELAAPGYAVMVAAPHGGAGVAAETMREALGKRGYLVDLGEVPGELAVVLPMEGTGEAEAERLAARVLADWGRQAPEPLTLGLAAADSLLQLREAYREAAEAARHGMFREVRGIVTRAETAAARDRYARQSPAAFRSRWQELSRQLRLHVLTLRSDAARGVLEEMFALIRLHEGAGKSYYDALLHALLVELLLLEDGRQPGEQAAGQPLRALGRVTELQDYMQQFVAALIGRLDTKRNRKDDYIAEKTIRLIEEKYGSGELCLTMLADELFVSQNHLGVLFKKATGMTVHQYIMECRMRKAEELLGKTRLKVSEVAGQVGMTNHSYFSTLFKQKHGMSPGEYQEFMQRR